MEKRDEKYDLPHEKQLKEYYKTVREFKEQNKENPLFKTEIKKLGQKLEKFKKKVYKDLKPWDRVLISRHPARPHTVDYLNQMFDSFHELHGDRTFSDDHALVGGFATLGDQKFMVIGQEKGSDTESRIHRNFGMMNPEGFRKALRLMKMAEKFNLPIISLLDTSGAYPCLEAEERGQGWAIAKNLQEMSRLHTPFIVVVIGEGCSGGALGIGIGDSIGILEHAYYSVISPEGCATILWKDAKRSTKAAESLKMNAEHLLELGIVDQIIEEPLGGAHHDPQFVFQKVREFILQEWDKLKEFSPELLVEQRYQKFRKMGKFETLS